ncbi:MAG TPA: protein kinase [Candidatus Obscuribacterales bacterium]
MKTCPECFNDYEDDSLEVCPDDSAQLRLIERDPLVGTVLDERYLIESVVGRGGMGVVYKARQQNMDKEMAIKMLYSHKVSEPEAIKRFHREAKTVSQVRHHHIINLYDFGMFQGQPYLVMDYLDGKSLKSVIKDEGPLSFERAAKIFPQVLEALSSAHRADVVHRDLKPENIMLVRANNQDDWVTIVDFGLSKLREVSGVAQEALNITKVGDVCGSPPYMSPEQCLSSLVVDPRSDLYAFGVVVYESLSGKLPFKAKSAIEMLDCHLYATPIPFNFATPEMKLCTEMTRVLNKALQKDADMRYQTAEEFALDLKEAIRRDGLKVRALKHREEVAQFHGLIEEAQAIQKASQEIDIPKGTREEPAAGAQLGASQADPAQADKTTGENPQAGATAAEQRDTSSHSPVASECPYCGAPVTAHIKFCPSCQRQLTGQDTRGLRSSRTRLGSSRGHKATDGNVAFSARAKSAGSSNLLRLLQKVLSLVLVIIALYAVYAASTNKDVLKSINRLVASLQK